VRSDPCWGGSDMRECPTAVPFSELATVNPSRDAAPSNPGEPVSFIAMSDVSEDGAWVNGQKRPFSSVKQGFTSFTEGDVLVAKITPCLENGKGCHARGLVGGVGFGSTEFHVLRAAPDISSRFLYHWSRSPLFRERAKAYMTGSAGQQRVSTEFFDRFLVPGLPLAEQRLIAEILDTADEAIRLTERAISKLEEVRKGLLHDLLTRGIDENGELRDPERNPEQFKDSALGRIPKSWKISEIGALGQCVTGATPPSGHEGLWGAGLVFVTPSEISWDGTMSVPSRSVAPSGQRFVRPIPRGSVLVVCIGSTLGKSSIAAGPCCTNQQINAVVPSGDVDSHFLEAAIRMQRPQLDALAGLQAVPIVNRTLFEAVLVPDPPPSEQRMIGGTIRGIDGRMAEVRVSLAKLRLVKEALSQDLLTGRVRVPIPEEATA
jgi:type I restriction enzyme, S subunit